MGFYLSNIPNYAEIALPLTELTNKKLKISWNEIKEQNKHLLPFVIYCAM